MSRVDLNRIPWPPGRSDVLGLIAAGALVDALANEAWGFAAGALVICAFAAAIPRMRGPFKLGPRALEGEFDEGPAAAPLEGEFEGTETRAPTRSPEQPQP